VDVHVHLNDLKDGKFYPLNTCRSLLLPGFLISLNMSSFSLAFSCPCCFCISSVSTLEAEEEEDTRALGRGEGAFVLFFIPAPGPFEDDSEGASTFSELPLLFPPLALVEVELVVDWEEDEMMAGRLEFGSPAESVGEGVLSLFLDSCCTLSSGVLRPLPLPVVGGVVEDTALLAIVAVALSSGRADDVNGAG
jgi:hypothetical protein